MENKRYKPIAMLLQNLEMALIFLIAFLFFTGFIWHQIEFSRPIVMKMTDTFLFFTNVVVLIFVLRKNYSIQLLIWSLLAFSITFMIEYMGVKTGKIFGDYYYGDTMLIQWGNVPVVIAFNWLILIMATNSIFMKVIGKKWLVSFLSPFLILIFDFVMEPVAMKLDYWQWANGTIPLQNYAAWFIIALFFSIILRFLNAIPDSKILRVYFFIQFLFFSLFRLEMLVFS